MEKVDYLIIGGGLAGCYAAEAIRENDELGSITIVTNESHLPYDRVPLSKNYLLGKMKRDALYIKKTDFYAEKKIKILREKNAIELDVQKHLVKLDDCSEIKFGKLLLSTGGQPRHLSIPGSNLEGVYYLRTIDDAESIQKSIPNSSKAVIIGSGFIGCELASSFSKKNISSTIIERGTKILGRVFDDGTAMWLKQHFENKGVEILTNSIPQRFVEKNGKVVAVETESGEHIPADFVAIGIGIIPNVDLAKNAGLCVDNGIVVDERLKTSVNDIYAAGDVANFYSPVFGKYIRLEHYDLAVRHGKIAGANMTGESQTFDELPYFFSFMFDLRIEVYGDMSKYDHVIVRSDSDDNGKFTKFYLDNGVVNAVMIVNQKEDVNSIKSLIRSRKKLTDETILNNDLIQLGVIVR